MGKKQYGSEDKRNLFRQNLVFSKWEISEKGENKINRDK